METIYMVLCKGKTDKWWEDEGAFFTIEEARAYIERDRPKFEHLRLKYAILEGHIVEESK